MKKLLLRALSLTAALLLPGTAIAGDALYSIRELKDVTSPLWQQTYHAYGRAIEINAEIIIPDAETAPVLSVRVMPSIPEPRYGELAARYHQPETADIYADEFISEDWRTAVVHGIPKAGWDESKGQVPGKVGQKTHALFEYDMHAAYADNNPLTLAEAAAIATDKALELFPDTALRLRNVALYDRPHWKKTGKPIGEKGFYYLELTQVLRGIPCMASVYNTFSQFSSDREDGFVRLSMLETRGTVFVDIYDENAYSVNCELYEETGMLCDDIPLLPFDAVKPQVEQLILSGYIRWIDSITLGYVQFDAADGEAILLVPAWVVWCEYDKQGPRHERSGPLYTQSAFAYQDAYRPIILNAQTGGLVDPESVAEDRFQWSGRDIP